MHRLRLPSWAYSAAWLLLGLLALRFLATAIEYFYGLPYPLPCKPLLTSARLGATLGAL